MSHEIAKSITLKGDSIRIVSRSSNVWPANYTTVEVPAGLDVLYREMKEGLIQPIDSANDYKWAYIDMVLNWNEGSDEERLARFKELVNSRQPEGRYAIRTSRGYVYKVNSSRVWFSHSLPAKYGFYEAHVKAKRLHMYDATVEKLSC